MSTTQEYVKLSNGKELVANELALLRDLAVHRRQASWLALCRGPVRADSGRRLVSGLDRQSTVARSPDGRLRARPTPASRQRD
jgi:hypothetical protein